MFWYRGEVLEAPDMLALWCRCCPGGRKRGHLLIRVQGVCEHRQLEFPSDLTLLSAAAGVGAAAGVAGQGLPGEGGGGPKHLSAWSLRCLGLRRGETHITTAVYRIRPMARGVARWLQGRAVQPEEQ